jgi:hypothetical protein
MCAPFKQGRTWTIRAHMERPGRKMSSQAIGNRQKSGKKTAAARAAPSLLATPPTPDKPAIPNEDHMTKPRQVNVTLDPNPKGAFKKLGGSQADDWNQRLGNLVASALPIDQSGGEEGLKASRAVYHAMIDLKPDDPIEGMLIGQLMAANEAALAMYRKGWAQPPEYFQARTKYLQLADKAARTVMILTGRLDHHRGRGQQQITVKHVTTNNVTADQRSLPRASPPAALAVSHRPRCWLPVPGRLCRSSTR